MFKIENGKLSFYQWDINQRLIIEEPSITEVHFCNRASDCSLVCEVYEEGGKRFVNVPNVLLQEDWTIRAYAYSENRTLIEENFIVYTRTKPADYIYTETEIKCLEALEKRMDKLEAALTTGGAAKVIETSGSHYLNDGARRTMPAMISFTDDDCRKEVYENIVNGEDCGLFALIKATNIPYTLACPPGNLHVKEDDGNDKYMTLDQLKEMCEYGVTLSCHHWRQYNMDDTQLLPTVDAYEADLKKCQDKFAEWGIKGVNTVSYPQGKYKRDYMTAAKKYYNMGFTVDRGINKIPYESFYMKRNEVFPTNGAYTLDDAKALVREVAASGGWLIFMTHAWYKTFNYKALAEDLIPYIREQGVEIVDVNTALERTGNVIEVGNFKKPLEENTDSYFVVDAYGTAWSNSLNLIKNDGEEIININAGWHDGYYLVPSGGFQEHKDTKRIISDKFDVKEGEVYRLTCSAIYTNCLFVVYNADGSVNDYLQPKTNTDAAIDGDTVLTDYEYTIKPGGAKMRVASNLNIQPDKYKIKRVDKVASAESSKLEGYATEEYVNKAIANKLAELEAQIAALKG